MYMQHVHTPFKGTAAAGIIFNEGFLSDAHRLCTPSSSAPDFHKCWSYDVFKIGTLRDRSSKNHPGIIISARAALQDLKSGI